MSPTRRGPAPAPEPAAGGPSHTGFDTLSGAFDDLRNRPACVLLVDDEPTVGNAARQLLADAPTLEYYYISDPSRALAALGEIGPAVVLLDLEMPVRNGIELLADIRAEPAFAGTPVVMLSDVDDAPTKARVFEAGADDFMIKLPPRIELQARLRRHASNFALHRERDQAVRLLRESQRRLQSLNLRLLQLSQRDGLTGLANRRFFDERLANELRRAHRAGVAAVSLLLLDIDHFKRYNDHYGHLQGDRCLIEVGAALRALARRAGDVAARYGGEEFALILPDTDADAAALLGEQLCDAVRALRHPHAAAPLGWLTVSVGHATSTPQDELDIGQLIGRADQALYRAKSAGRNRVAA